MDTSPAYLKGARESFPAAEVEVTRSGRDRGNGRLLDDLLDPSQIPLETVRAYQPKPAFQEFRQLSPTLTEARPERWCEEASASALPPTAKVTETGRRHTPGILGWFGSRIRNGIIEAMYFLVQARKVRARRVPQLTRKPLGR